MTTKFLRKTVALLVNNSFTENLLPLATLNDVNIDNDKDANKNRQFVISAADSLKAAQRTKDLVDRISPNSKLHFAQDAPIYQRVKRAEANLIKQFLQQQKCNIYSKQPFKAKSGFFKNKKAEFPTIDKLELGGQQSRVLLADRVSLFPEAHPFVVDTRNKPAIIQPATYPVFGNLSNGVLINIEQIRNAILFKRSPASASLTSKVSQNRSGQEGRPIQAPRLLSEYKKQLYECRKIRVLYGNLSQKDLYRSAKRAKQIKGSLGENLILALETRLDVTLQRCGFFPTIRSAKQSITHNRIKLNSVIINVPSYQMQPGDVVKVLPKAQSRKYARETDLSFVYNKRKQDASLSKQTVFFTDNQRTTGLVPAAKAFGAEESFRWQYIASADMLWFLSHFQHSIITASFSHSNPCNLNKNQPLITARQEIDPVGRFVLTRNISSILNHFIDKPENRLFGKTSIDSYRLCALFQDTDRLTRLTPTPGYGLSEIKRQGRLSGTGQQNRLSRLINKVDQRLSILSFKLNKMFDRIEDVCAISSREDLSRPLNKSFMLQNSSERKAVKAKHVSQSWRAFSNMFCYWSYVKKNLIALDSQQNRSLNQNRLRDDREFARPKFTNHAGLHTAEAYRKKRDQGGHYLISYLQSGLYTARPASDPNLLILFPGLASHLQSQNKKEEEAEEARQRREKQEDRKWVAQQSCARKAELIEPVDQTGSFLESPLSRKRKQSTYRTKPYKSTCKALHVEVSYQNLCAIFLFMPQRIYMPAALDIDLLIKALHP